MTDEVKRKIAELRTRGFGYKKVSAILGLPLSTVRSYCKRNHVNQEVLEEEARHTQACLQCGKPVKQTEGRKEKKFCCDICRKKWWNDHRHLMKHRLLTKVECPHCHTVFLVAGNLKRKYCCHACYIAERFGRKEECQKAGKIAM